MTAAEVASQIAASKDGILDFYVPQNTTAQKYTSAIRKQLNRKNVRGVLLAISTIGEDAVVVAKLGYKCLYGRREREVRR